MLLPGGGVLIDNPGMREAQLWVGDEGLADAFPDVTELADTCRFSDCRHETEPGCAVRAALEDGRLSADRWRRYEALDAELTALSDELAQRERAGSRRRPPRPEPADARVCASATAREGALQRESTRDGMGADTPELALVDPDLAVRARAGARRAAGPIACAARGAVRCDAEREGARPGAHIPWARVTAAVWLLALGIMVGGAAIPHAQDKPRVIPRDEDLTVCIPPKSPGNARPPGSGPGIVGRQQSPANARLELSHGRRTGTRSAGRRRSSTPPGPAAVAPRSSATTGRVLGHEPRRRSVRALHLARPGWSGR